MVNEFGDGVMQSLGLGLAWKVSKHNMVLTHVSADTSTRLCRDNNEDAPQWINLILLLNSLNTPCLQCHIN